MEKKINLFSELMAGLFSGCLGGLLDGLIAGLFFAIMSLGLIIYIIISALEDLGPLKFLFWALLLIGGSFLILGLLYGFAMSSGKLVFGLSFGLSFALSFALGFVLANIILFLAAYIAGVILYGLFSLVSYLFIEKWIG